MKNLGKECGCYMHFPVSYAGFFAKSQIMFFLLSSFRFCPSLKNDGRGELRFREVVNDFLPKKKSTGNVSCPHVFVAKGKNKKRKLSPDTGKVSAELTKGASWSRHGKIEISMSIIINQNENRHPVF